MLAPPPWTHPYPAGVPGPKTWEQLALLHEELAAYSPRLARLPALVVANKAETLAAPERTLAALQKRTELPVRGGRGGA